MKNKGDTLPSTCLVQLHKNSIKFKVQSTCVCFETGNLLSMALYQGHYMSSQHKNKHPYINVQMCLSLQPGVVKPLQNQCSVKQSIFDSHNFSSVGPAESLKKARSVSWLLIVASLLLLCSLCSCELKESKPLEVPTIIM